ncbi:MAG: sensor histidine kinase [Candidatus Dormibacteraeota bacterium]|jgi:two-component system CitB family sensor kinase|nr:sensor histidine kinase [Candidatus Dormibacteraeota bacterium]
MKPHLPLATKILAFQIGVVFAAVVVGGAASLWFARQRLETQYEQRALAIAEATASIPAIHTALLSGDPGGTIEQVAEGIRKSSGASFVVVTDRRGIRYSHPNPALIGKPVDEDPTSVLAGNQYMGSQHGTLGDSARGKTPIRDRGQVIGLVSVGYPAATVWSEVLGELPAVALIMALALAFGLAGSVLLSRHLKRETFGLEPWEIAGLLEEREASLQGIREGALATDRGGRVTLANPEALRLLGLENNPVGLKASQVVPPGRLRDLVSGRLPGKDQMVLAGPRMLVASRMPVIVRGEAIGHVITFRDRTELERLTSEAAGAAQLTDALRAQSHEFSNRLHTIAGLLELGHTEEAMRLIAESSGHSQEREESLLNEVEDPVLRALLLAKTAVAAERGIDLRLEHDGLGVDGSAQLATYPLEPQELITLVGNLIDNAMDAAAHSPESERWVRISLARQNGELVVQVQDSGPGVDPGIAERMFREGFTTKPQRSRRPRGLGLALVQQVVRRHGGEVSVRNEGGAVVTVRLPTNAPSSAG